VTVRVQLPPVLRFVMGDRKFIEADGETIGALLSDLAAKHPALGLHFRDERGAIRHNIVFLHDGALVRAKDAAAHRVKDGDEVVVTNALAGG
jgi:molybdopterin converting factor small subunit